MNNLSYDEIPNWQKFEELIAEYFRSVTEIPGMNVLSLDVKPSGTGPDGGKDLLIDMLIPDFIKQAKRRWVVQCKFEKESVSTKSISEINLPSLVHSHGADGYLLILKSRPTQKLVDLFDRLNATCSHGYCYEVWTGEQLKSRLLVAPPRIHQQFFPLYATFIADQEKKGGHQ